MRLCLASDVTIGSPDQSLTTSVIGPTRNSSCTYLTLLCAGTASTSAPEFQGEAFSQFGRVYRYFIGVKALYPGSGDSVKFFL